MTPDDVPEHLLTEIAAGHCVAFVGAGFSAAAGLPTGRTLLAALAGIDGLDDGVRAWVRGVAERPGASPDHKDQAAQLLQDRLGRDRIIAHLRSLLAVEHPPPAMRDRLRWLRGIPFRAIVTTNFDDVLAGRVPGPEVYRAILRPHKYRWWEEAFWGDERGAPVIKIHGDVTVPDAEEHVVLTRRDYRRRLYGDPGYMTFLRGLLSTNTVLFLGFSFEDAYLNELRSQVLSLFDADPAGDGRKPLAYAILGDVPALVRDHFAQHEGIEVLGFDSHGRSDYRGFDAILQAIWQRAAILPRFGRLLEGKRLLWLDPNPHNNDAGYRFLKRASGSIGREQVHAITSVATVDRAISALGRPARPAFDLVLTHWGWRCATDDEGNRVPNAVRLLQQLRAHDVRCPVVVFSGRRDLARRKKRCLALGAQNYCTDWPALFQTIERLFEAG